MALMKNLVLETANAPGTGSISLNGAPAGRIPFVTAFGDGTAAYMFATDGIQSEWGLWTVHAGTPNTISRDTTIGNSAGTTAHLNFTGAITVYAEIPAERSIMASGDNAAVDIGSRRLTSIGPGVANTDAPQLGQVGWVLIQETIITSAAGAVTFALDLSKYRRFCLEVVEAGPVTEAVGYIRFSNDGGATYRSLAGDYLSVGAGMVNTAPGPVSSGGGSGGYGPVVGSCATCTGRIVFPANPSLIDYDLSLRGAANFGKGNGVMILNFGSCTHILFGFVSTSIAFGTFRFLGMPV